MKFEVYMETIIMWIWIIIMGTIFCYALVDEFISKDDSENDDWIYHL